MAKLSLREVARYSLSTRAKDGAVHAGPNGMRKPQTTSEGAVLMSVIKVGLGVGLLLLACACGSDTQPTAYSSLKGVSGGLTESSLVFGQALLPCELLGECPASPQVLIARTFAELDRLLPLASQDAKVDFSHQMVAVWPSRSGTYFKSYVEEVQSMAGAITIMIVRCEFPDVNGHSDRTRYAIALPSSDEPIKVTERRAFDVRFGSQWEGVLTEPCLAKVEART